jgi:hypothetical protein
VGRGWGVQIVDKRGMAVIMTFKILDKILVGTLFKQRLTFDINISQSFEGT